MSVLYLTGGCTKLPVIKSYQVDYSSQDDSFYFHYNVMLANMYIIKSNHNNYFMVLTLKIDDFGAGFAQPSLPDILGVPSCRSHDKLF